MNTHFKPFAFRLSPLRSAAAAVLGASLLAACGGGGGDSPQAVKLQFAALNGSSAVSCTGSLSGLGSTAASAKLQDLRFYVSEVELVDAKGNVTPVKLDAVTNWQIAGSGAAGVALVDLAAAGEACDATSPETHTEVVGSADGGDYTKVRFKIGVPLALNHSNVVGAAAPLDIAALNWSWAGGRKFLNIEVNADAPTTLTTFNVHLGSTGCTGSSPATGLVDTCARPDRMTVELAFDRKASAQNVVIDLAQLFQGVDITQDSSGAPGCMSGATDAECVPVYGNLGLDLSTGLPTSSTAQRIFRLATSSGAL